MIDIGVSTLTFVKVTLFEVMAANFRTLNDIITYHNDIKQDIAMKIAIIHNLKESERGGIVKEKYDVSEIHTTHTHTHTYIYICIYMYMYIYICIYIYI